MDANHVADVASPAEEAPNSKAEVDRFEVNRRFESELDLVEIIASQISRSIDNCVEFDELLAAGREGLFDAARRFNPKLGASFRTYANYRVEGAIIDTLRRSLQLPRRAYQRLLALEAASRVSEGDYSPGLRDTATWRTRKSPEDFINDEIAAIATAAAMSVELSTGGASASAGSTPEEAYEQAEFSAFVQSALNELSEQEATAIRLRYFEDKSHDGAATVMGMSKPWAHRLHTRGMDKLAKRLRQAGYG